MAKYRLLADHVTPDGRVVSAGTEVEDWPGGPSNQMEGVDDEGKKKVNELHQNLYGRDAPEPRARERDEEAEKQEREAIEGEPVSEQQRREYEAIKKDEPLTEVPQSAPRSPTVTASPTRGGQQRAAPGPATPRTEPENVRPTKPNEEQYPKD